MATKGFYQLKGSSPSGGNDDDGSLLEKLAQAVVTGKEKHYFSASSSCKFPQLPR